MVSTSRIARAALLAAFAAMSGEAAGNARCPSCGEAEVRHELDLGCDICAACGHVLSERALTASVQFDEDGAQGVFLHDGGTRGQHLAAARSGLAMAPGAAPGVARSMFRDEQSTHLANIHRAVDFAAQQLRLTKDAAADARALVVRACEGRWGEGDWTTLLVGACVYCAARQNTLPIAMRDVAEACQLDVFALGRVYNKLKRLFAVVVPPVRADAFVARAAAAVPELTKDSIGTFGTRALRKGGTAGEETNGRHSGTASFTRDESTRSRSNDDAFFRIDETRGETRAASASRAKDLAPLVEDAKSLLSFAETRGLLVGRNPVPFVAAALSVAAEARGVTLSHEKAGAAARASASAARRASHSLRVELVSFAKTFEWGAEVRLKTLRAFLPSLVPHVAGALEARQSRKTAHGDETETRRREPPIGGSAATVVSAELARAAAMRVEAMPVSFRAHEKTRLAREARLWRAKTETLAALAEAGDACFGAREKKNAEGGLGRLDLDRGDDDDDVELAATNALARPEPRTATVTASANLDATAEPSNAADDDSEARRGGSDLVVLAERAPRSSTATVAVKRPSRGGVRAKGRRKKEPDLPSGVDAPAETRTGPGLNPRGISTAETRPALPAPEGVSPDASRESPPFAEPDGAPLDAADFDWSDVALRRLLLEGIPETFLAQEQALHADSDAAAEASRRGADESTKNKNAKKNAGFARAVRGSLKNPFAIGADADASATEACRRVRRRTRDALGGRDALLGGAALPGGVTWKTPPSAFVERCDKEAMDAIPDAEIQCLLRTAEEAAFARALAERERLDRGEPSRRGSAAAGSEEADEADEAPSAALAASATAGGRGTGKEKRPRSNRVKFERRVENRAR